jgi:ribulose-phosphate 3-epimerase
MVKPFVDKIDLILVMSVDPGFGGQGYIAESTNRIKEIKQFLSDNCLERVQIQVDGGIKLHNAKEVIIAGGDILVAGSEVFCANDPVEVIKEFYSIAKK